MALYYFDIRDSGGVVADEEGTDCHDLVHAVLEAEASARDIIKQFVTSKRVSANTFVDILDEKRVVVGSLRVIETIENPLKPHVVLVTDDNHTTSGGSFALEVSRHRSVQWSIARERAALDARETVERRRWGTIKAHYSAQSDK